MDPILNGLHIAILVTDGFEQVEFTELKKVLEGEGAITKVVSNQLEQVQGYGQGAMGDLFSVDLTLQEADPDDFDAILLPGGAASAERLSGVAEARHLLQGMDAKSKPAAATVSGC